MNNVAPHTNINEDHGKVVGSRGTIPSKINRVKPGDGTHIVDSEAIVEDVKAKDKLDILEERLKAIEGVGNYGLGDAVGLCLVPDVVIPAKFQGPEFEKYRGATCPKNHLTMYCRKMVAHAHDNKMLIHFFQDSLARMACNWYMHLEPTRVHSWKDMVDAFIKQYQYNLDMAPDRLQLQGMEKKEVESFKEYAQRWREVAAQVEPPLSDKEMVTMFLSTLQHPFYEHMVGIVSYKFSNIVIIEERVEAGIRSGRICSSMIANINEFESQSREKKERKAYFVTQSPCNLNANRNLSQNPNQANNQKPFIPIHVSYTELLPWLVKKKLVAISPMKLVRPPYPKSYDPEAKCDYHAGAIKHSIERCLGLIHKVQFLIDLGQLTFAEESSRIKENT